MTTARAPAAFAVAMRLDAAARMRPSRVGAGSPASCSGMVTGVPVMLPSGVTTTTARCPAFKSTAITGQARSASRDGTGRAGVFYDASVNQRPRAGS